MGQRHVCSDDNFLKSLKICVFPTDVFGHVAVSFEGLCPVLLLSTQISSSNVHDDVPFQGETWSNTVLVTIAIFEFFVCLGW